jgi:hypothetical protein
MRPASAPVRSRSPNKRSGMIGCRARHSFTTLMKKPTRQENMLVKIPEYQARAGSDACDRAVVGDGSGALTSLGEAGRQQRERRGGQDRGTQALNSARSDQPGR